MPMSLPTDTTLVRIETRQYELFGRPLGQGVNRRKLAFGIATAVTWSAILLLAGLSPLTRFGPMLFIAPPVGLVVIGTRLDHLGRMQCLTWYDWLLARRPSRRLTITNPLLPPPAARMLTVHAVCELRPGGAR